MIDKMIGHFEEKIGSKYLVLNDVNEKKEVSKKYEEVWKGVKKKLNMGNIFKKLGLNLMMICQWINLQNYFYWQQLLGVFLAMMANFTLSYF